MRGKSLRWVIVYPDGREQTILDVPKFDFNWQGAAAVGRGTQLVSW